MSIVTEARDFAIFHHGRIHQRRKYTGEPYIMHPYQVMSLVRTVPHTPAMLAASWLHDLVEDTDVTSEEVHARFGEEVGTMVDWLTDVSRPEDGPRVARKAIDRDHIAAAPAQVKTIKIADLIRNTQTIVKHDPGFAKVYLPEKQSLLKVLVGGNIRLWIMAYNLTRN